MKNTANTHEASSAGDKPPRVPTDKITATGPVAAKMKPIKPLASGVVPKSAQARGAGLGAGRSRWCSKGWPVSKGGGPQHNKPGQPG